MLTSRWFLAAQRIPTAAFFGHSRYSQIFDGLTLNGKTVRLDIRAIMPALEEGFDGGVNVAKEGKMKWTFTEKSCNESTYWKVPEYAEPNLPAKIGIEPSREENKVLISVSQTVDAEVDLNRRRRLRLMYHESWCFQAGDHETKRISIQVEPGDLKGIQIMMESMLPYLYGWTLIPIDVGEKYEETKQRGYSVKPSLNRGSPTTPSQIGGPSVDDFFG